VASTVLRRGDNCEAVFLFDIFVVHYKVLQKEKDAIAKKLSETIVEKEFLKGKLVSLVSSGALYFIH